MGDNRVKPKWWAVGEHVRVALMRGANAGGWSRIYIAPFGAGADFDDPPEFAAVALHFHVDPGEPIDPHYFDAAKQSEILRAQVEALQRVGRATWKPAGILGPTGVTVLSTRLPWELRHAGLGAF